MEDLIARSQFLFGSDIPPDDIGEVYPHPDDEPDLIGFDSGGRSWRLLRRSVVEQILNDDPPTAWAAAQRLAASGLDRHEALDQLARGMYYGIADAASKESDDPDDAFKSDVTEAYDRVPLPDEDDVYDALTRVSARDQGIDAATLMQRVVVGLGRSERDGVALAQVRLALRDAVEDADELGLLGGRVVNRRALASSVVLTHRLTAAEAADGQLRQVATDLCLFARATEPVLPDGSELDIVSAEGGLAWAGAEDWLQDFAAGYLVAVRVDADEVVTVEQVADVPVDDRLVAALSDAFDDLATDAAVPVGALTAYVSIDRPEAFRSPQAPVTELCTLAGLELRGPYAGTTLEHWDQLHVQRRHDRLHEATDDDEAVHAALDVLDDLEDPDAAAGVLRDALRELADDPVAELVLDELAPPDGDPDAELTQPSRRGEIVDRLLAVARRADDVAVARWIAGVVAERDGDVFGAEAHFLAGQAADPGFEPVVDRCAWYASDRGDAATAARLWNTLAEPPSDEVETVAQFARPRHRPPGRNDPCWCGSGRKYKTCHQRQPQQAPLPERVGWLCRKATSYLMRHEGDAKLDVVGNVVALAGGDHDAMFEFAVRDPLVVDAALTEGGWFARFLDVRGPLLPDDEQLLAASWLLVDRTVYEVLGVDRGHSIDVRDLRSGDQLTISEHTLSTTVTVGSRFCARAVPDGVGHQIVGAVFPVPLGREADVLDLCDRGDPLELCGFVASTRRPPALSTREGERIVECEAVLHVTDQDAAIAALDTLYEPNDDGWVELHQLDDDESIVRATMRLDGQRLTVLTHSTERMDRVLTTLRDTLPTAAVVSDERSPVELGQFPQRMPGTDRGMGTSTGAELSETQRGEIVSMMEYRWLRQPVPALGGVTPLDAAADPTRRPQLERLIDSFPEVDGPLMTMRRARLREALGL